MEKIPCPVDILDREKPKNALPVAKWQMELFKANPGNAQHKVDAVWRNNMAERALGVDHPDVKALQSEFNDVLQSYFASRDESMESAA